MDERWTPRPTAEHNMSGASCPRPARGGMPEEAVDVVVILAIAIACTIGGASGGAAGLAMAILFALASVIAIVYLRFDPHITHTANGFALIHTRRMRDGSLARVFRQGGVYQSATYLDGRRFEPVFAYQRAFDIVFDLEGQKFERTGRGVVDVLALGGGGYAWPKHALMSHDNLHMDVVEIDEAVTRAARRWFFVDELEARAGDRLYIITADGRAYLEGERDAGRYDAIVNDTFSGHEPVLALATVEAARAARSLLAPGGLYVANVVSHEGGTELTFLRDTAATLRQVFARVWIVPATDEQFDGEDNYLVIASDEPYAVVGSIPFDEEFLGTPMTDAA